MSLLMRAQQAQRQQEELPLSDKSQAFMQLREQVQHTLSADEIATLQRVNPAQAKTEVRAACRQVFAGAAWEWCSQQTRDELSQAVLDSMFGLGPLEELLYDESVTEIMVNGPNKVFVERDGVLSATDLRFVDEAQVRQIIDRILGPLGRRVDESSPLVDARLEQGHRVHVVLPPVALDGPVLTIRKFASTTLTLDDLCARGTMPESVAMLLTWAVKARKSIAVSGGTGAGKTTLLNALSCCIPPGERIITIEDSAELRFFEHPHVVRLEARPANAEGSGQISIRDLVVNALRMRPDRIVVGECRGAEALDMLQAMNTGHEGSLTTLHANSPEEVIPRLTTMVRYAADLPVEVVEEYIARAITMVVQVTRGLDGRRYISAVAEYSYDAHAREPRVTPLYRARAVSVARAGEVDSSAEQAEGFKVADDEELAVKETDWQGNAGSTTDGQSCRAWDVQGEWLDKPSWLDEVVRLGLVSAGEVERWMALVELQ